MKAFFLFVFLVLLAPIKAEKITGRVFPDGTEFALHAPISVLPNGGFFPVRVEIRNKASQSLTWNIQCRATLENYSYGFRRSTSREGEIRSDFTVTCPAGEERQIDLLVPAHQAAGSRSIQFQCSSGDGDRSLGGSQSLGSGSYSVGISKDFAQSFESEISDAFQRMGGSSSRSSYSSLGYGLIDLARLPEDWRAYGGYDILVITRADLLSLVPGVKLALDQWVRSGGHLVLLNDVKADSEAMSEIDGLGRRTRVDCGPGFKDFNDRKFSNVLKASGDPLADIGAGDYRGGDWVLGKLLGTRTQSKIFLLFTLIIFAIVVGPVNLFFWANKNRRHRLFVTTPIISLAASLLLVGFIVIRDGFGGSGVRAVAIEVGGPDDKSAVILQEQFSRSGILFSSGFELDGDSVLSPLVPPVTDLNLEDSANSTGTYNLGFEQSKEGWTVNGNLFRSRGEQAQLLRSVVPSRERLELLPGNPESPRLVSSFSYPLTALYYQDGAGRIWRASGISPGESIEMTASATVIDRQGEMRDAISRFGATHRKKLAALLSRPNSFVALAAEAPSVATHSSIDWWESPTLITGLLSQ